MSKPNKPKPKTQGGVDFFGNPIEGGDELEAINEIEFMPKVTRERKAKNMDDFNFDEY